MSSTRMHRYSLAALLPHYVRAVTGAAIAAAVMLFTGFSSAMLWIAAPIGVLFLAFGAVTALRQATVIEISSAGIRTIGPVPREILWEDLSKVDLRYYSTKKDRGDGWMQLSIGGGGRRIRIESSIEDFERLARTVADAAARRGLELSPSSLANFEALGALTRREVRPGSGNG